MDKHKGLKDSSILIDFSNSNSYISPEDIKAYI